MYFYSDTEVKQPFTGRMRDVDPSAMYVRHYGNYIELSWMASQPTLSHIERRQVEKEIGIALKKMDYWYKRPGFILADALQHVQRLKKLWNFEPKQPHKGVN